MPRHCSTSTFAQSLAGYKRWSREKRVQLRVSRGQRLRRQRERRGRLVLGHGLHGVLAMRRGLLREGGGGGLKKGEELREQDAVVA